MTIILHLPACSMVIRSGVVAAGLSGFYVQFFNGLIVILALSAIDGTRSATGRAGRRCVSALKLRRSGVGGFLREQRVAGQEPQEIVAQVLNLHAGRLQHLGIAGRVQEVEDRDAAARLQHANKLG